MAGVDTGRLCAAMVSALQHFCPGDRGCVAYTRARESEKERAHALH